MAEQMALSRISAQVIGGSVVITVDPRTAVVVAEAFAEWHRDRPAGDDRRHWASEVDSLVAVARRAAGEAQRVDVPLVTPDAVVQHAIASIRPAEVSS